MSDTPTVKEVFLALLSAEEVSDRKFRWFRTARITGCPPVIHEAEEIEMPLESVAMTLWKKAERIVKALNAPSHL